MMLWGRALVRKLRGDDGCRREAPSIPPAYRALLNDNGRLVIPVGQRTATSISCRVVRVTRRGASFTDEGLISGDWNTLIGADGFSDR